MYIAIKLNDMKETDLRIGNYLQIDSLTDGSNTIVDIGLFHLNEIGSIKHQYKGNKNKTGK